MIKWFLLTAGDLNSRTEMVVCHLEVVICRNLVFWNAFHAQKKLRNFLEHFNFYNCQARSPLL